MTKLNEGAAVSIADLNARAAGETPHEFQYLLSGYKPTGIFISVLGAHCNVVKEAINRELNARRQLETARTAAAARTKGADVEITTVEEQEAFTHRLAAVRIAGWRGIAEPYSPELAYDLVRDNPEVREQVLEASNDIGNFMKVSPKI